MITVVDVNDPIEVREAGLQALNDALGPNVARAFIDLYFGGTGDYTAEKYERPEMTEVEFNGFIERAKVETEQRRAQMLA